MKTFPIPHELQPVKTLPVNVPTQFEQDADIERFERENSLVKTPQGWRPEKRNGAADRRESEKP
jgi:hypothetical protein